MRMEDMVKFKIVDGKIVTTKGAVNIEQQKTLCGEYLEGVVKEIYKTRRMFLNSEKTKYLLSKSDRVYDDVSRGTKNVSMYIKAIDQWRESLENDCKIQV